MKISAIFFLASFLFLMPEANELFAAPKGAWSGWGKKTLFSKQVTHYVLDGIGVQTGAADQVWCVVLDDGRLAIGKRKSAFETIRDKPFGRLESNLEGFDWSYLELDVRDKALANRYYNLLTTDLGTHSRLVDDHREQEVSDKFNGLLVSYWAQNMDDGNRRMDHAVILGRQSAYIPQSWPMGAARDEDALTLEAELYGLKRSDFRQQREMRFLIGFLDRICEGNMGDIESLDLLSDFDPADFIEILSQIMSDASAAE